MGSEAAEMTPAEQLREIAVQHYGTGVSIEHEDECRAKYQLLMKAADTLDSLEWKRVEDEPPDWTSETVMLWKMEQGGYEIGECNWMVGVKHVSTPTHYREFGGVPE